MLVQEKKGNIESTDIGNRTIDYLALEWFETQKRIMHKHSQAGIEVAIKFLGGGQNLTQGDILFMDDKTVIAVDILPCEVIVIRPKNMFEMASVCYEIGNKHLPLFYDNEDVLVVFDAPLFRLLSASGYDVSQDNRKLLNPLKTSVAAHGHNGGPGESLFSKIMKLTNPQ
ncbi:urease accessory protein UreE [Mucilaginibacter sp. PPCGB 2223]|uniref:urease accessory protein UreE n=1 Tax=Mucilaginibacter sp. PPCGB 2223 TaxID=1886027 RepID=UPI0008263ADF|nr:urease accessory protein UreE [Mucilaginibacter sp. PPCGB 2223]OCX54875.1 urease accessory protein UreE [Mucilaginibacter sp. PPCGB 2223]